MPCFAVFSTPLWGPLSPFAVFQSFAVFSRTLVYKFLTRIVKLIRVKITQIKLNWIAAKTLLLHNLTLLNGNSIRTDTKVGHIRVLKSLCWSLMAKSTRTEAKFNANILIARARKIHAYLRREGNVYIKQTKKNYEWQLSTAYREIIV